MKTKPYSPFRIACLALVTLAAMIGVTSAKAATPQRTYVTTYTATALPTFPATVDASATATNDVWVDVSRHDVVAIQVTGALTATNPAAATLSIPVHRSIDGVTAESTATTTLVLTFTGTQVKTWATNMSTGGFGYIRLGPSIANTGTNGATGLSVTIAGKPPWSLTYPYAGP